MWSPGAAKQLTFLCGNINHVWLVVMCQRSKVNHWVGSGYNSIGTDVAVYTWAYTTLPVSEWPKGPKCLRNTFLVASPSLGASVSVCVSLTVYVWRQSANVVWLTASVHVSLHHVVLWVATEVLYIFPFKINTLLRYTLVSVLVLGTGIGSSLHHLLWQWRIRLGSGLGCGWYMDAQTAARFDGNGAIHTAGRVRQPAIAIHTASRVYSIVLFHYTGNWGTMPNGTTRISLQLVQTMDGCVMQCNIITSSSSSFVWTQVVN